MAFELSSYCSAWTSSFDKLKVSIFYTYICLQNLEKQVDKNLLKKKKNPTFADDEKTPLDTHCCDRIDNQNREVGHDNDYDNYVKSNFSKVDDATLMTPTCNNEHEISTLQLRQ